MTKYVNVTINDHKYLLPAASVGMAVVLVCSCSVLVCSCAVSTGRSVAIVPLMSIGMTGRMAVV